MFISLIWEVNQLLQLNDVTIRYGSWSPIEALTTSFGQSPRVGIVGANGVGKTTLLNAIAGLLSVSTGSINFRNQEWTNLSVRARVKDGLSYVPDHKGLHSFLTIEENLQLAPSPLDPDFVSELHVALPRLSERSKVPVGSLSGGEQQAVALMRAFRQDAHLVLLDEPTLGLAPDVASRLKNVILRRTRPDQLLIIAEQNIAFCVGLCTEIYLMNTNGKLRLVSDDQALNLVDFLNFE